MQSYTWLASIFGPLLIIMGVWGLFYRDNMLKVVASIKANPGALYLISVLNLWAGLLIVNSYNAWTANLLIFVTLLGWALILRGAICLFLPRLALKIKGREGKRYSIRAIIALVWGLVLTWVAFWMY